MKHLQCNQCKLIFGERPEVYRWTREPSADKICGASRYTGQPCYGLLQEMSPEAIAQREDQQKRLEHAMKYL